MPTLQNIKGVMPKQQLKASYEAMLNNGGLPQGLPIGLSALDNNCRFDRGKLITIAGDTQSGKSSLVTYLCAKFQQKYGLNTLFYSAEWDTNYHINRLTKITDNQNTDDLLDHFYFLDRSQVWDYHNILSTCTELIDNGTKIDILVIDCYNRLNNTYLNTETEYIGQMLNELSRYAIAKNIMIMIVAHTRKRDTSGHPSLSDITGSQNYANMSDYVIIPYRKKNKSETRLSIAKVKSENYGNVCDIDVWFDASSGTYLGAAPAFSKYLLDRNGFSGEQILDITVSGFRSSHDKTPVDINLYEFLTTDVAKECVRKIRDCKDEAEQKRLKKELPLASVSVRFKGGKAKKNIIEKSGLICIDIDGKDNPDIIDRVPDILRALPYVAFFERSCRGYGYFAIVPIECPEMFVEYFSALQSDFAELGITIDKTCKDETRLRAATYDENYYVNPSTAVYSKLLSESPKPPKEEKTKIGDYTTFITALNETLKESEREIKGLKRAVAIVNEGHINAFSDYNSWLRLGYALAYTLDEGGRQYFHALSRYYPGYNEKECDDQYSACLNTRDTNNHYNSDSVFSLLRKQGVNIYPLGLYPENKHI